VAGKANSVDGSGGRAKTVSLHGRSISYREAGAGPALLLIHGMAGTSEGWDAVIGPLARNHTVIAPDFPGHGESEPGGGDYSLGGLAAGLRDLLAVLGHDRATLVGHSLGGGVALQFTYQFPEIVERLVLVSSGGLGPEVSPVLRAAALPGADLFISATASIGGRVGSVVGRGLGMVGLRPSADVAEVARGYASLADAGRRRAFLSTLSSVVGTNGQRVAATDRLYLAEALPLLIVWGSRDPIIPAGHAEAAHEALPGSRLEIFDGVGHLPQLEEPTRFVEVIESFVAESEPAGFDREEWRARFSTPRG
jgi:pimeloyl-ACP methyl ester carboxylesterase